MPARPTGQAHQAHARGTSRCGLRRCRHSLIVDDDR